MEVEINGRDDLLDQDQLLSEEFNAPEFITSLLRNVRPGEETKRLHHLRQILTARSNTTAETIKDVVFDHYRQFIEASKEISNLERDIYQLSALLTEQKNLIENLMEMSGHEKRSSCSASLYSAGSGANQQNQQLQTLMHKLDGVASVLNSMDEQERVLLQGQMTLLDSDTMQSKHPIYIVLLSSNLLIGHPSPAGGSGQRHPFTLVSNHPLESLALVNVRGTPVGTVIDTTSSATSASGEPNLVQLLVFPEQMYLRCESARTKREWLESLEEAKRRQQEEKALVRQATIRARRRNILHSIASSGASGSPIKKGRKGSVQQQQGIGKNNDAIGEEEEDNGDNGKGTGERQQMMAVEDTAWLNELVNELQDVISHRHMDEAVEMLLEWKSCACKNQALNAKFAAIERQVIEMVTEEVKRPGMLHGGLRTISQPIQQLIALGRTAYAVEIYLRRRSAALRSAARELTISEEPLSYVRQVAILFINDIVEVCHELATHRDQLCQVLAWSSRELSVLLSLIRKNVIEVAPTMAVLTHTWRILMGKCAQLVPIGLDLSFEVNRLAAPSLKSALEANFANILNSIQLRNSEERWVPFSLESDQNLIRFLEEMSDIGLQMDWAICSPTSPCPSSTDAPPQNRFALNVAQSACLFARIALQLSRDLAVLNTSPQLQQLSDSLMRLIWNEQLAHLTAGMHKSLVHHCTSRFIVSQVLPLCEKVYQGGDESEGMFHRLLTSNFPHLLHFQRKPSNLFAHEEEDDEEVANV